MEKIVNYIIIVIAALNLYYLSPVVGVSTSSAIIVCCLISFFFFVKHINTIRVRKSKNFLFLFFFIIVSVLCIPLNIGKGYDVFYNNILRLTWYIMLVYWTFALYGPKSISKFLLSLSILAFAISVLLLIFELTNPAEFRLIVFDAYDPDALSNRVTITYRDPNSFSSAIVFFLYLILSFSKKTSVKILFIIVAALIVNKTGSRMGALMFAVALLFFLFKVMHKISLPAKFTLALLLICIGYSVSMFVGRQMEKSENDSLISRVLGHDIYADNAKYSAEERVSTVEDGIEFAFSDNFINPPGSLFFTSKWQGTSRHLHTFPHNSFVYVIGEYGMFSIYVFILLFKLFRESIVKKYYIVGLLLFIQLFFLPVFLYSFFFPLSIFIIENNILNPENNFYRL